MNIRDLHTLIVQRLAWGRTIELNRKQCADLRDSLIRANALLLEAQSFDQRNETTDAFGTALRALEAGGELVPLPDPIESEPVQPAAATKP